MFGYREPFHISDSGKQSLVYISKNLFKFPYPKNKNWVIESRTFLDFRFRKLSAPTRPRSCGDIGSGCLREDSPSLMICLFWSMTVEVRLQRTFLHFRFRKTNPSHVSAGEKYLSASIIFRLYAEITLRMRAYRTYLRRFLSYANVAAVHALPDYVAVAWKYQSFFKVFN